ncbi:hypothetical protein MUCCIDRAFT_84372 [Mucor lusitanicus CBS 277.49]|uniref:Uncharacterized protein n=1 Tax=Mucor lusitanicus CBS 277.49 TaxID=747725 RepID=A0A168I1T1_MUCCL|nr:hypothetical protein MUCCIDRAFT_84372 [Mucor lusitanicus CBS 277.49]
MLWIICDFFDALCIAMPVFIFSESYDIAHLWEDEGEVEKFANEKDDFKEEMCGLEELDNNAPSFKATAQNRKTCIPGLLEKDPLYLVTVFHAYAHSMHCQVQFHPKIVEGSDGEGKERFWSTANKFIAMIHQMTAQTARKFVKAFAKVRELNMTKEEYFDLERQWKAHAEVVMIPATAVGVEILIARVDSSNAAARDSYYLQLNIELLLLNDMKDENGNRIEITRGRNLKRKIFLESQIVKLQAKYGYSPISSLEDEQFNAHRTVMAAKIIFSLEALKKKAEAIIVMINNFVKKSYSEDTEEERRRRKETVVGREVESIRKYANENGMDLPSYLQKWHVLKRNVEEISLLIMFLGRIANAAAPVLVPSRESVNLDNKVVVFPEEASAYDTEQYQALSEVEEESDNGSDDEDLAEGAR